MSIRSSLSFAEVQDTLFYRLNHFLKQHNQATAGKGDRNFVALNHNEHSSQIVGCARLLALQENKNYWLRGVFVPLDLRQQGIASQLLTFMHHQTGSAKLYAFAEGYLENFYLRLGYQHCNYTELPLTLQEHYSLTQIEQKRWLILYYQSER